MTSQIILFICCFLIGVISSFKVSLRSWSILSRRQTNLPIFSIEDGIPLIDLKAPELESQFLRKSITRWLNEEYIPLEIHSTIGKEVGESYLRSREGGVQDLGAFLMHLGNDLEQRVDFHDAYVNAWDVANRSSDLLLLLLNREMCECAGDLQSAQKIAIELGLLQPISATPLPEEILKNTSIGAFRKVDYDRLCNKLKNEFSRYSYVRELLQEDTHVDWLELNRVIALMVGYKYINKNQFIQNDTISPLEWTDLKQPPDFTNIYDRVLNQYLLDHMPRSHKDMNTLLQQMVGYEPYQMLQKSTDPLIARKILIAKWLYLKGFFNAPFPPEERFVLEPDDEDEYEEIEEEDEGKKRMYER